MRLKHKIGRELPCKSHLHSLSVSFAFAFGQCLGTLIRVIFLSFLCRRIKAALLPAHGPEPMSYSTGVQHNVNSPLFREVFTVRIPESKLASKTLQVHVWSVTEDGDEECLVS